MSRTRETIICRIILMVSMFCIVGSFCCSCKSDNSDFPFVEGFFVDETTISSENTIFDDTSNEPIVISLAVPYSQNTIEYLGKLYYAKLNGLLSEGVNGSTVTLEELDSIDVPFSFQVTYSSLEGVNDSSLINSEDAPDIYLTSNNSGMYLDGRAVGLNEYLYDNPLFDNTIVNLSALHYSYANTDDYVLCGVPHYMSYMVLMGNSDYVSQQDIYRLSLDDFYSLLTNIDISSNEIDIDASEGETDSTNLDNSQHVVPFANGIELLPFISDAFREGSEDSVVSSYLHSSEYADNGFELDSELIDSLNRELNYIDELYGNGLSSNANGMGADLVYSRQASMWIGSSTDIGLWNEYYPDSLVLSLIPTDYDEASSVPFLTTYYLCVSPECEQAEFASDFAAFISLDTDALLLLSRLEPMDGVLPVVNNSTVWDAYELNPQTGSLVSIIESMVNSNEAYYMNDILNRYSLNDIELYLQNYSDARFADGTVDYNVEFDLVSLYGQ